MSGRPPPLELRLEVCQYAADHTDAEAAAKFGFTTNTISRWRKQLGYPPKQRHGRRR